MSIQGSAKRQSPGLVNFVTALAYHFCLPLPAAFTQPGDHLIAKPCICALILHNIFRLHCIVTSSCRELPGDPDPVLAADVVGLQPAARLPRRLRQPLHPLLSPRHGQTQIMSGLETNKDSKLQAVITQSRAPSIALKPTSRHARVTFRGTLRRLGRETSLSPLFPSFESLCQ